MQSKILKKGVGWGGGFRSKVWTPEHTLKNQSGNFLHVTVYCKQNNIKIFHYTIINIGSTLLAVQFVYLLFSFAISSKLFLPKVEQFSVPVTKMAQKFILWCSIYVLLTVVITLQMTNSGSFAIARGLEKRRSYHALMGYRSSPHDFGNSGRYNGGVKRNNKLPSVVYSSRQR